VLRLASTLDAEDDDAVKTLVHKVKEAVNVQREHMRLEDEYLIKPLLAKTYYAATAGASATPPSAAPSSQALAISVTPHDSVTSQSVGAASLSLMSRQPPQQNAPSKRKIPQEDEHAEEKNQLTHIVLDSETLLNTSPRHSFQVKQFYGSVSEFIFEYYQHLHGEEHGFVQSIESHFSKVELLELATAFVKHFDKDIMPDNLHYTLLGTNSDERVQFLSMLRRTRPAEEFDNLVSTVCKSTLSEASYESLCGRLHIRL